MLMVQTEAYIEKTKMMDLKIRKASHLFLAADWEKPGNANSHKIQYLTHQSVGVWSVWFKISMWLVHLQPS